MASLRTTCVNRVEGCIIEIAVKSLEAHTAGICAKLHQEARESRWFAECIVYFLLSTKVNNPPLQLFWVANRKLAHTLFDSGLLGQNYPFSRPEADIKRHTPHQMKCS